MAFTGETGQLVIGKIDAELRFAIQNEIYLVEALKDIAIPFHRRNDF